MNKFKLLSLLLLFISAEVYSGSKVFWVRGDAWRVFGEQNKLIYVSGVMDGLIAGKKENTALHYKMNLSNDTYIKGLNDLYKDYRNIKIPAFMLFDLVPRMVAGEEDKVIKQELIELRKDFSE